MKKNIFLVMMVVAFVGSLSSCAKCLKCKNSVESIKVCTKDNEDQASLDDSKLYYESDGYKCTMSSGGL